MRMLEEDRQEWVVMDGTASLRHPQRPSLCAEASVMLSAPISSRKSPPLTFALNLNL